MNKKGISLLVLAITIIVLAILTGTVILRLKNDHQIERAREVAFKSDLKSMQDTIDIYISDKQLEDKNFSITAVNASTLSEIEGILTKLPSEYIGIVVISRGKLLYIGEDENELSWASDLNATPDTVIYDDDNTSAIDANELID